MILGRRQSTTIHITVAGVGESGKKNVAGILKDLRTMNFPLGKMNAAGAENETACICMLDYCTSVSEELVSWEELKEDPADLTRGVFILTGNPLEPGFQIYAASAVDLLSKSETIRIAVFTTEDSAMPGRTAMLEQQMDHIVAAKEKSAGVMIEDMILALFMPENMYGTYNPAGLRSLLNRSTGEIIMRCGTVHQNCFSNTLPALVNAMALEVGKEMRPGVIYQPVIICRGDISMDLLYPAVEKFRELFGEKMPDEIIAVHRTEKGVSPYYCTMLMIEKKEGNV